MEHTREDALQEREIRRFLGPVETVGKTLLCFDEIDSTNTYVRQLALDGGDDGTVVIADGQTGGRGRMGRSFQSPRGKGVYLTALLRPQLPVERLLPVTSLAGLAVCGAVERTCGFRPGLKWPNDPVIGQKKICGILTESVLDPTSGTAALALGIGLNVHQTAADFTPEVAEMAASLDTALGREICRPALAAALIEEVDRLYAVLRTGELDASLNAYRRDCVTLGKQVQLISPDGSRETATALDIDADFGLVVRDAQGEERTIRSGEVSVRGMYGYVE